MSQASWSNSCYDEQSIIAHYEAVVKRLHKRARACWDSRSQVAVDAQMDLSSPKLACQGVWQQF